MGGVSDSLQYLTFITSLMEHRGFWRTSGVFHTSLIGRWGFWLCVARGIYGHNGPGKWLIVASDFHKHVVIRVGIITDTSPRLLIPMVTLVGGLGFWAHWVAFVWVILIIGRGLSTDLMLQLILLPEMFSVAQSVEVRRSNRRSELHIHHTTHAI